ncbi:MAG: hypothetical protein KF753_23570 [Caldilineaceae bacterium]|nr:hypothetical protein [Caldilineaceae bacterium]
MSSQPTKRFTLPLGLWLDFAAAALLALLTVAFFWRTLSGDVYQPADGGDLVSFLYPTYRFAASVLASGHLPLWNPTLYGGAPFIADIQAGFLYPPNLLLFLLKPEFGYGWMQWLAIGHLWWAGLGVYALCRALGISRPAALFAGTAFAFSDPLLIHLGNLNLIAVLSWLGWVLAAFHLALARRSLAWAGAAGLLFAMATYAGHAQSSYYIGLAVAGYWVIGILGDWEIGNWRRFGNLPSLLSHLQYPLATAIITLLLTAPLLLSSLELLPYTARADLAYQENVGYSLAPVPALVGLITPGFFGRGPALHWSFWDRVELPYAGVVALLLALAVFFRSSTFAKSRTSDAPLLPWIGLALFGLLVALGVYTPVHGWLTQLLPGFASFRAPARAIVLWTFSIAVLAGYGVDWLTADGGRQTTDGRRSTQHAAIRTQYLRFLGLGSLVLLVVFVPATYASLLALQADSVWFLRASLAGLAVALATGAWLGTWALISLHRRGYLRGRLLAGLLTALLLIEVGAAGAYTDISENDPARGFNHPEILAFLQQEWNADNADWADQRGSEKSAQSASSVKSAFPFRIDARTDIDDLWQPDTAALAGLRDVWGIVNPLLLTHWERLWESTGGRYTRLYDMLNAGYVLVRDGTPLPDKFVLAYDAPGELAVYRNPDAFPRAWLVPAAVTVPDADAALAALTAPEFDPATTVVLLTGDGGRQTADGGRTTPNHPITQSPTIQYPLSDSPNFLEFHFSSPTPAFLVLSEVWYPGWRATVNGVETPVRRANYALRSVAVPAGEVTVEMRFAPDSWRWGLGLAGVGLVLLLGLVVGRRGLPHPIAFATPSSICDAIG